MSPTVNPAPRSAKKSVRRYPRKAEKIAGTNQRMMKAIKGHACGPCNTRIKQARLSYNCLTRHLSLVTYHFLTRAISSVVERLLHTQEVAGSNPASRTIRLVSRGHACI